MIPTRIDVYLAGVIGLPWQGRSRPLFVGTGQKTGPVEICPVLVFTHTHMNYQPRVLVLFQQTKSFCAVLLRTGRYDGSRSVAMRLKIRTRS